MIREMLKTTLAALRSAFRSRATLFALGRGILLRLLVALEGRA
jgi:hypothetical protein